MTLRAPRAALLAALPLLLAAGCASASAETHTSADHPSAPAGTAASASGTSAPSESASMVCGPEIQQSVATILALPTPPHAVPSWQPPVFTCTYHLTNGPLVVSVTEGGTPAAAADHFAELRREVGSTQPLRGLDSLGLPAFESPDGIVAFVKDDKTLEVDPTALPAVVNDQQRTRGDLAYTVATDILGCWNGG